MEDLTSAVNQLAARVAAMEAQKTAEAEKSLLPKDDELVSVTSGRNLWKQNHTMPYGSIKNAPGLAHDKAANRWTIDEIPSIGEQLKGFPR